MPVSRENRDVVADALAAFLRGEMSEDAFRNRLDPIWVGLCRNAVQDEHLSQLCGLLLTKTLVDLRALSEEEWRRLVREIAFLKSDLEPKRESSRPSDDPDPPAQIRLARWHLLGLAAALGFGFLVGWRLPAIYCVVSWVSFTIWVERQDAARDKERFKQLDEELAFAPFACEGDWLAHKHLLEPYHLPEYDVAIHFRPRKFSPAQKFWRAVPFYLVPIVLNGFMCAFSLLLWPLWLVFWPLFLIHMSLQSVNRGRGSEPPGQ